MKYFNQKKRYTLFFASLSTLFFRTLFLALREREKAKKEERAARKRKGKKERTYRKSAIANNKFFNLA